MVLPTQTTVLIVGAGPTGLSAAISLFKHGIKDFIIVDAAERTPDTSRAMGIHAATLEALESIGCADPLVNLGIKAHSMNVWDRKSLLISNQMTSALESYTKYPYLLLLPQSKTEAVLENHLKELGVNIHRPYRVVGMKGDVDELGNTQVSFESGEIINAQYVIGADGARSVIRQLNGITFTDPDGVPVDDSLAQVVIADVVFSHDKPALPKDNAIACVHDRAFSLIIPIPIPKSPSSQEQTYRIAFNIPSAHGVPPPSNPPLSYLQDHFNAVAPFELTSNPKLTSEPIHIVKSLWSSRFRVHAASAEKTVFRMHERSDCDTLGGYVFLVGDAAHIHSPAGGQGMNLGIRDAIGLGSVLAEHMRTTPSETLAQGKISPLEAYGEQRHKSAVRVIGLTKRIMGVLVALGTSSRVINLQYWMIRLLGSIPAVRRMVAWEVSGLGNR